jgi:hypothetical protein
MYQRGWRRCPAFVFRLLLLLLMSSNLSCSTVMLIRSCSHLIPGVGDICCLSHLVAHNDTPQNGSIRLNFLGIEMESAHSIFTTHHETPAIPETTQN